MLTQSGQDQQTTRQGQGWGTGGRNQLSSSGSWTLRKMHVAYIQNILGKFQGVQGSSEALQRSLGSKFYPKAEE